MAAGAVNKNDPNDARSVAAAALRSPSRRQVQPDDHAAVLKVRAKRHRDLGRTRTQVVCRLHAVLCELVPGGVSKAITAGQTALVLGSITPSGAVQAARCELAAAFLDDLRRIDAQLLDAHKKLAAAVRASGTTLTQVFGVGPVVAAGGVSVPGGLEMEADEADQARARALRRRPRHALRGRHADTGGLARIPEPR